MAEIPRRRMTLADAALLVAATAAGLYLLRIADGLGLFARSSLQVAPGVPAPLSRQLIEYLAVGGGCFLAPWTLLTLALGLRQPRPARREAIRGPGFLACAAATVASTPAVAYFLVQAWLSRHDAVSQLPVYFNNAFGRLAFAAGPAIVGAWLAATLTGGWRPSPSWTDRFGRLIGSGWIGIYLYREMYPILKPLVTW